MVERKVQSAEDFELRSVKIYSDRYLGKEINITQLVAEINIFEQLNSLYLTGSITFIDDQNVFEGLNIQGTEYIDIELKLPFKEAASVTKSFVILNVDKIIKNNDYTNTIHVNIREARGYYNDLIKYSKMYDGTGESIIQKIVEDKLNSNIYNFDWRSTGPIQFNRSFQKTFRYIVPYISPMDAIKTILSKITTKSGMPYFCSSALLTNDFLLTDLESILQSNSFNTTPFTYSQSMAQSGNTSSQAYSIQKIKGDSVEDALLIAQLGAIGSSYAMTELRTGKAFDIHVNMKEIFDTFKTLGILNQSDEFFIDNEFQPEKLIDPTIKNSTIADRMYDYDSRRFFDISGNTYEEDVLNFSEESELSDYLLRPISLAVRRHLLKNTYTITVPGIHFLNPDRVNTSVGNKINLRVFRSNTNNSPAEDSKRSGDFIILAKRHVFNCSSYKHKVILDCGRLSKTQGV